MFDQLRECIGQLEKMSGKAIPMPAYTQSQQKQEAPTDKLMAEYDDVLEKEFIKDEMGQVFARVQFEAAQKYLIETFMATPEGRKLSEEREQAFRAYKDEKLKDFLESKKAKPATEQTPENASS